MTQPVGRFAPTPSGRMHLGNVFAALLAWLSVRSQKGKMVLRMEDLDTQRTSEEYAAVLRDDLRWLGLDWDEETPPQSQRSAVYETFVYGTMEGRGARPLPSLFSQQNECPIAFPSGADYSLLFRLHMLFTGSTRQAQMTPSNKEIMACTSAP